MHSEISFCLYYFQTLSKTLNETKQYKLVVLLGVTKHSSSLVYDTSLFH